MMSLLQVIKETRNKFRTIVFLETFSFYIFFFHSLVLNLYLLMRNKKLISFIDWEKTTLHWIVNKAYNAVSQAWLTPCISRLIYWVPQMFLQIKAEKESALCFFSNCFLITWYILFPGPYLENKGSHET